LAAERQAGERADPDTFARALLVTGSVLLLWRLRQPVLVAFDTAAAACSTWAPDTPTGRCS
jgi:hypothetical protein